MTTGIQEVTRYRTEDGIEHHTLDEAETHVVKLTMQEDLSKAFNDLPSYLVEDIANWFIGNYNFTPKG